MNKVKNRAFILFFISGFCGLLYEVVWTRLALTSFGCITPVLSVVVSVFMLGLALGSWLGGRWVARLTAWANVSPLVLYGLAELLIGFGALAVPRQFALGEQALLSAGNHDSGLYLFLSAIILFLSLLPWTLLMGATFPLMMSAMRQQLRAEPRTFSYLYAANGVGGAAGAFLSAHVLIEICGFRDTLHLAGILNLLIAALALSLARTSGNPGPAEELAASASKSQSPSQSAVVLATILFATGFASMAMEVTWSRIFNPALGGSAYVFSFILTVYLLATFAGSLVYRHWPQQQKQPRLGELSVWLALLTLLPILTMDVRLHLRHLGVVLGIAPVCLLMGYLTPRLIDEYAIGRPREAGWAYALNIVGCIVGPVAASYLLLPLLGERPLTIALSSVFLALALTLDPGSRGQPRLLATAALTLGLMAFTASGSRLYIEGTRFRVFAIRRDYTATVATYWNEKMGPGLLVNGIGMTHRTPITKAMVHLPLAFHRTPPESALIICFGMGTSYRSALSWGIETTAIELVPSVVQAFGHYHSDAAQVLNDPHGHIVIDDGRRFLKRTSTSYDVIVLDPPPPISAPGSGMLYSTEFYELARSHLKTGGILQQWLPVSEPRVVAAALRSISSVFPHISTYVSLENWGLHVLASMQPIEAPDAATMLKRMPAKAKADFTEWDRVSVGQLVAAALRQPIDYHTRMEQAGLLEITDDRPFNEYYFLRKLGENL